MKWLGFIVAVSFFITGCSRADVQTILDGYMWQKRPIVIFAPRLDTPEYAEQLKELDSNAGALEERDVIVLNIVNLEHVILDGQQQPHMSTNPFYKEFDVRKNKFAAFLIGKDGMVKIQSGQPIPAKTLIETIDAMPMRQRETER